MIPVFFEKKAWLLPLFALPAAGLWLVRDHGPAAATATPPEKIDLALRRTAHALLRLAGDSTSRIPPVERAGERRWRVRLAEPFAYDSLPALLEGSLRLHGIEQPYEVAIRPCDDAGAIDLGYHQSDFLEDKNVPCGGRQAPGGCHFMEVVFLEKSGPAGGFPQKTAGLLLALGTAAALFFFIKKREKPTTPSPPIADPGGENWLEFGRSHLDVGGLAIICGGTRQPLTFREAKLLRLFAENPGRLLTREFLLEKVWADEGLLTGRSLDMFVSRLRKKLAGDPSLSIVAVHGVGYRLETGRV